MAQQRRINDRYRLDEVIGSGGMGAVWRGFDERLGRPVAVKEVRFPSTMSDQERAELTKRAMVEARSAARLDHPNIVPVYDVILEDERPFIIMRLIDGGSLKDVVTRAGPLTPTRAAEVGIQLLDALAAAHAAQIIHRDVKPQNVMIDRDGTALLADFSIAAVFGSETLTGTGVLLGSPGYIAPERLASGRSGPPGDLFALGATLFYAVEGVGPFVAKETIAGLFATAVRPHPRPERAGRLTPVIDGLLVKDPDERLTGPQARAMLREIADGLLVREPDQADSPTDEDVFVPPPPGWHTTALRPDAAAGAAPAGGWRSAGRGSGLGGSGGGSWRRRVVAAAVILVLAAGAGLAVRLATNPRHNDHAGNNGAILDPSLSPGVTSPTVSPTTVATSTHATTATPTGGAATTKPADATPAVKQAVLTLPNAGGYVGPCTSFSIQVTVTITLTTGPATVSYKVQQVDGTYYAETVRVTKAKPTVRKVYSFQQSNPKTGAAIFGLTVSQPVNKLWQTEADYPISCTTTLPSPSETPQSAKP